MTEICIFTDGSGDNLVKKKGGSAVYFEQKKYHKYNISQQYVGTNITNQTTELRACILGIKKCVSIMTKKNIEWKIIIKTDSMYSINCATVWGKKWIQYGWKRKEKGKYVKIKNRDIVEELYILSTIYPVEYIHVKAHQKKPEKDTKEWKNWHGNNMADKLAKHALKL
jgi:ribonuclease HI